MKYGWKIIMISSALLGIGATVFYAYYEPQTWIGGFCFASQYDPEQPNLQNLSHYLLMTNGASLPDNADAYLFNKLNQTNKESQEYKNILGFYAIQSPSSRAGSLIFENGADHLPEIIRYGRETTDPTTQAGFLYLAYGVARKSMAYKPGFYSPQTAQEHFSLIDQGKFQEIGHQDL